MIFAYPPTHTVFLLMEVQLLRKIQALERVVSGFLTMLSWIVDQKEFPRFSSKLSLFAEFVAARRGIRSAPLDGKVMIYSDHDFIVNFINDPEITKGMIRKHPEILEEWKLLQRAIKQYASGSVTAVLVDGDSNDYSKAAHNLACAASGSRDRFAGDFPLILDSQSHARLALQRT